MNWFQKRIAERSTWTGIGAIATGIATAVGAPELAPVGDVVAQTGPDLVAGNWSVVGPLIAGLLAIFVPTSRREG